MSDAPVADEGEKDAKRRRVGEAVRLWAGTTLGGVTLLGALAIWYLRRRGQAVRERLGPVREVDWPEPKGSERDGG